VSARTTERRAKALRDRRRPQQFDLFGESRPKTAGDMPTWSALPVEARSALIELIAQLILEHSERTQRNPTTVGAGHDL
jgi:hypothetical protein